MYPANSSPNIRNVQCGQQTPSNHSRPTQPTYNRAGISPGATVVSSTSEFRRVGGSLADMTISAFGIRRNETKTVKTTYSDGYVSEDKTYFNHQDYPVLANFSTQPLAIKKDYFKRSWIQVLVKVANIPIAQNDPANVGTLQMDSFDMDSLVLHTLVSLGSDFTDLITNLVVTIELPFLSNLSRVLPRDMGQTRGYMLVEDVVQRIQAFKSLENLKVVLKLPHTFRKNLHELQLVFARPFYALRFTDWELNYIVPGMRQDEPVSDDDIDYLEQYHYFLLDQSH